MSDRQILKVLDLLAAAIIDLAGDETYFALLEAGEARSIIADLILHSRNEADGE